MSIATTGKNNPRYYEILDTTKEFIIQLYKDEKTVYQIEKICKERNFKVTDYKIKNFLIEMGLIK